MSNVAPKPAKKLLPMLILEILRTYTDENHHLSQREIREKLEELYDMKVDRKAVRRNIGNLMDMGCAIEYREAVRKIPNRKTGKLEENYSMSDIWLAREFTESELRLIIDGLLFSRHIPRGQRKRLIEKLISLASGYFKAHVKHVSSMPDDPFHNSEIFYTISVLDEAIDKKCKVAFSYLEYGIDKKQHKKLRDDGSVHEYVVSPYQMVAKEGKYYLICNYDKYDDISNYRIDRIADVRLLEDERVKLFTSLSGSGRTGLDLARYMDEHVYMYSSANSQCVFLITRPMISDVVDMFGRGVRFEEGPDDYVTATVRVNERSMQQFAKNFAPDVLILEPRRLADEVREESERTVEAYRNLNQLVFP